MEIVQEDVQYLNSIQRSLPPYGIPITELAINSAIKGLKKKAYDQYGISAEHLRKARHKIIPFITKTINCIVKKKDIPLNLKTGKLLTIPKKGKDQNQITNLHGLTIYSILGKVIDQITLNHQEQCTNTNHLQCGFTKGQSPAEAILVVTEAICETTD